MEINIGYGDLKMIVALRKESVDRNGDVKWKIVATYGRSPQGERG